MVLLKTSSKQEGGATLNESARKAIDMAIGYFMVERGITRGRMAELMGMSRNTLRWKREGKYDWTWSEILRLSELTGKTPNELAGITQAA